MMQASCSRLDAARWHFQHGPIDLILTVDGKADAIARALDSAWSRFQQVLPELVDELPDRIAGIEVPLRPARGEEASGDRRDIEAAIDRVGIAAAERCDERPGSGGDLRKRHPAGSDQILVADHALRSKVPGVLPEAPGEHGELTAEAVGLGIEPEAEVVIKHLRCRLAALVPVGFGGLPGEEDRERIADDCMAGESLLERP